FTPLPGAGPAFTADPVTLPEATAGTAYSRSLAGSASDPDGNPLFFAKLAGPAWLSISPEGLATGTPALTDSCLNTFQVSVSDGTRFDLATLNVFVAAGPRWNDGNDDFFYAPATQDTAYTGDLAANVIYCGPQTLSYAKVSGPAWLNVASNGALSGTPDRTNVLENVWVVTVSDGASTNDAILRILVTGSPKFVSSPVQAGNARVGVAYGSSTLLGTAVDPQNQPLTFAKVASGGPGPDWLTVSPDGSLSGVPGAANLGTNSWTVSASNGAFPATLNTLRVVVLPGGISGPVQVVSREYWDGVENPHAVDGVTLSGSGTAEDPATYTVPRGLVLSANGQIYTSKPTGPNSQQDGTAPEALHLRIQVDGNLEMAGNNNAFVIAVHARNSGIGQKNLVLDLNGNSLLGQGRIVGLGNRVDPVAFPDCFDRDTPRIVTITNARDVSLFDINVQARDANNWGRPLSIQATGTVQVASGIDNSDRDGGGDGGNDVSVTARTIAVGSVRTDSARTGGFRNVGKITLRALAPPGYSAADGANNSSNNWIRVTGNLRASTPQPSTTWGVIATESVVLELGPDAAVNAGANSPVTPADKALWNVGLIKNGASAADLFRNQSAGLFTASHTVDWSGRVPSVVPPSPTLVLGAATPGQVVLSWTGAGFVLQQNPD
ncbi:MAG: putative Ig domain-containing protein, partial [Verrucomicrobiota bacterium]